MKKQTRKMLKVLAAAVFMLLCAALFTVTSFAARLPGDMNGDGKITAADARIVLRIAAGLDSVENYMDDETPEEPEPEDTKADIPVDVNFEIEYSITDNGYFIGGESTATVSVTTDADLPSAELKITDVTGKTVYAATLGNMKTGQTVTVEWDGKTDGGAYANSGDYSVIITAGENEETLEGLTFTAENYFSSGNGSEVNPFLVASKEDFENIVRFPKAFFKQTADIDYNYSETKSMFTKDAQFNGTYDGNGKVFSNILSNNPLINYVGENGTVKNVTVKDSSFSEDALIAHNYGTVDNCSVSANIACTTIPSTNIGLICGTNEGIIINCKATGTASLTTSSGYAIAGGIAGKNYGKIISCISEVAVSSKGAIHHDAGFAGGIVGTNESSGFIQNSEAKGTISVAYKKGGIAGNNDGQINNSIYTGESNVNLSGGGNGIVA